MPICKKVLKTAAVFMAAAILAASSGVSAEAFCPPCLPSVCAAFFFPQAQGRKSRRRARRRHRGRADFFIRFVWCITSSFASDRTDFRILNIIIQYDSIKRKIQTASFRQNPPYETEALRNYYEICACFFRCPLTSAAGCDTIQGKSNENEVRHEYDTEILRSGLWGPRAADL